MKGLAIYIGKTNRWLKHFRIYKIQYLSSMSPVKIYDQSNLKNPECINLSLKKFNLNFKKIEETINPEKKGKIVKKQALKLVKTGYYYLKDKQGAPRVTVCLGLHADGRVAKGVSVCSMSENPIKKRGRDKALFQVHRAFLGRKNQMFTRYWAMQAISTLPDTDKFWEISDGWKHCYLTDSHLPFHFVNSVEKKIVESWGPVE